MGEGRWAWLQAPAQTERVNHRAELQPDGRIGRTGHWPISDVTPVDSDAQLVGDSEHHAGIGRPSDPALHAHASDTGRVEIRAVKTVASHIRQAAAEVRVDAAE